MRLRPGDPEPPSLALVAGVALHEVAQAWSGPAHPLSLKWPNDLMVDGAKLAGILLERSGDAVVVGIGANLAARPEGLDRPTASFVSLGLAAPDPEAFLISLADGFARWVQIWRGQGLAPVRAAWLKVAHPIGAPLLAGDAEGLFGGLDADGALRLLRADGTTLIIRAGDVFLL